MMTPQVYTQITHSVRVSVRPIYLEAQSTPEDNQYIWAYHVTIENMGPKTIQLKSRYWQITDAFGRTQEVRGNGVVGENPLLHPGEIYEYTSGTPLSTPSGMMIGKYRMETIEGESFEVEVPAFSLDSPHQLVSLN